MKDKINQLTRTAYHEAGHTISAIHLKLSFQYVTINQKGSILGFTRNKLPKWFDPNIIDERIEKRIIKEIVNFYSGEATEFILTRKHHSLEANSDYKHIVKLAYSIYGNKNDMEILLRRMEKRAYDYVKKPHIWQQIKLIAEELLKRKVLKANEVRKIIASIRYVH